MKKIVFTITSIVLSITSLLATAKINLDIAKRYLTSDGKTQKLFGLIEITNFYYQYYFVLFGFIALGFAIFATVRKEKKIINQISYGLAIFSIIIIFVRLWRIMI